MGIRESSVYKKWIRHLRDDRTRYRTTAACQDTGKELIILLCGGDKATQDEDIKQAKRRAAAMNPDEEK
ncbi:MAG: hypothetical protein LBI85_06830 [Spirochaetaceae bacterium]|jgi:putative component of toxin-antitoxin plasmid stabilization module|nr:hypothetical protein [Spirochaetaceae bacterium]